MPSEPHLRYLLERAAADHPDARLRFPEQDSEQRLSYSELLARARIVAGSLGDRGLGCDARVGLLLPTSADFVVSLFGILLSGAAAVVLPPPLPFGRLSSAADQLRAVAGCAGLGGLIAAPGLEQLAAEAGVGPVYDLARLEIPGPAGRPPTTIDPHSPALIQFTSGSTTAPRGAVTSHHAIVSEIVAITSASGFGLTDMYCSWLPLYHDFGIMGLLTCVYAGGSGVLLRPEHFIANPLIWLEAMSRYRVTISAAPNFAYAMVAARMARAPCAALDLSAWRIAYNGGEPVDPCTIDTFTAALAGSGFARATVWPSYGLAEATLAVSLPRVGKAPLELTLDRTALTNRGIVREVKPETVTAKRVVSVGTPLPGITVAIEESEGAPPGGVVGEICVSGPTIMTGYHDDPHATARVLADGWLATGDLGFLHAGELFITGRLKDVIIVRGRNFYPEDIERVVNAVPGIRPGTAVAVASIGAEGEQVSVFAETKLTDPDGLAAATAVIDARMAAELLPRPGMVALLPPATLPKTSSGKLQRRRTLMLYEAGLLPVRHHRNAIAAAEARTA